ncbi:MAG: hypothetical protein U0414_07535 [Polyangiaceae bacterium]
MQRRALAVAALTSLVTACSDERLTPLPSDPPFVPPPESCAPVDVELPRRFTPCSKGSGIFGTWVLDGSGLPAYAYGLDQNADPRAAWTHTESAERRDHWAAFGNARVNGLFYNDGYVEVVDQDRGVEYLDKFDRGNGAYGGGYSFVDDGTEVWSSAYAFRPRGAEADRRFGVGYGEATTTYRGIAVKHILFAPKGDAPLVVDEVTIENTSAETRSLRHYEYFDVGRRPIEIGWIASGSALTSIPSDLRASRDARNGLFTERVDYDAPAAALTLRRAHAAGVTPPDRGAPSETDYFPGDPFLVCAVGSVTDTYTDQGAFFGSGDPTAPAAPRSRAPGEGAATGERGGATSGTGQPRMFAMRSDVELAPGESTKLRFLYGFAPWGEPLPIDPGLRDPTRDHLAELQADLADKLVYFATNAEPALHREMAWHAYQMEASVGRREYFEGPVVPQGSAYLYLHGADGAARDLGVFTIPLVYSHPALARAELELYMRVQFAADGRFSYAFQGHGVLDDALGLHAQPSDLDLFFLWALGEYLGATGDLDLLDARVPFYPKEAKPDAIVLDHVEAAVRHLIDVVGVGEHGLIGLGDGDWSDGIALEAPNHALAVEKGESVPNTQMAIAVLPRIAAILEPRAPALASEITTKVAAYRQALPSAWGGSFFGRAYFGDGALIRGANVDLEAQVWALIGEEAAPVERDAIIDSVLHTLDEPSPTGAMLQAHGMVWPAISGLLTDGYARSRPDLAWSHYTRNTMFAHALAWPEQWFGIWSGPDGLDGPDMDRPGESWFSPATPMTDFPVQNNNQHAMPLYATLRVAGVEATADGLAIEPRAPAPFTLETRTVDVALRADSLTIRYRPSGSAERRVRVVAPKGRAIARATRDGVEIPAGSASVEFMVPAGANRATELVLTLL